MFELQLLPARDPRVRVIWRQLEGPAAASYFLSWGWIENWLACLSDDELPHLAVLREHGQPVAAYFLAERLMRRHLAVWSHAVYVNATGDARHDGLRVEHNGILRAPDRRVSLETMIEYLPGGWDELYLPAVDRTAFPELNRLTGREITGREDAGFRVLIDRDLSAPFVDLELVRAVPGGYLGCLSSTMRAQIRRARDELGELRIEIARDERHAFDIYAELVRLHGQYWHLRGQRGAFGEPFFDHFHRRLIAQRVPHGEIDLVRVSANGHTLGCLYNLIHRDRVLFYQCGLASSSAPHIRPADLCHAAAVEHYAAAGLSVYDLLGDDPRYTQDLSTGAAQLLWLRVQRTRTRFRVEDGMRELKHAISGWRERRFVAVPSRA